MAKRKQAPSLDITDTERTSWRIPKKGDEGEWYPVARVGRYIPFGYEQDENDPDILQPIPFELELLEKAKLYLNEYSSRLVARWLSENSGRYISHVGLIKRVSIEEKRRRQGAAYRNYARRAEEAAEKALRLEEARIGGKGTRSLYSSGGGDSTDSSEGES